MRYSHEARHYLYGVSVRIKEKIESLCEDDAELADDPNALFKALKDKEFITYVSPIPPKYASNPDQALGTFQV